MEVSQKIENTDYTLSPEFLVKLKSGKLKLGVAWATYSFSVSFLWWVIHPGDIRIKESV